MIDMPSEIILRAVLDVFSYWTYKCVSYAFIRQQAHINKEHDLIITLLLYYLTSISFSSPHNSTFIVMLFPLFCASLGKSDCCMLSWHYQP